LNKITKSLLRGALLLKFSHFLKTRGIFPEGIELHSLVQVAAMVRNFDTGPDLPLGGEVAGVGGRPAV
jgi:hypothetical protein